MSYSYWRITDANRSMTKESQAVRVDYFTLISSRLQPSAIPFISQLFWRATVTLRIVYDPARYRTLRVWSVEYVCETDRMSCGCPCGATKCPALAFRWRYTWPAHRCRCVDVAGWQRCRTLSSLKHADQSTYKQNSAHLLYTVSQKTTLT